MFIFLVCWLVGWLGGRGISASCMLCVVRWVKLKLKLGWVGVGVGRFDDKY